MWRAKIIARQRLDFSAQPSAEHADDCDGPLRGLGQPDCAMPRAIDDGNPGSARQARELRPSRVGIDGLIQAAGAAHSKI